MPVPKHRQVKYQRQSTRPRRLIEDVLDQDQTDETTEVTLELLDDEVFRPTDELFQEWLLTRPDLVFSGAAVQRWAYQQHVAYGNAIARITAEIALRARAA